MQARLFDPDEVMAQMLFEWDERGNKRSGERDGGGLRVELREEHAEVMYSSTDWERSGWGSGSGSGWGSGSG
eukprot:768035-Hanusia_phi.AAC.2